MAASASVQAADKIGVVNVQEVFQQMPAREAVAKQLENEFKGRATALQAQETALQSQMQNLQRNSGSMKAADRAKLEKQVMANREDFSAKAQAFDNDNRKRQAEERNKILGRIQDAVKTVAAKDGLDIVIDANALAYASNDAKDITDEVLKQVK
jgi:outer membrane protein